MKKQLVIGLGTGRSGTVSFVDFFEHQPSCVMLHEGSMHDKRTILNWDGDHDRVIKWLAEVENMSGLATHFGDTGFYYLPYVETIIEHYPDARFVCFERERDQVVASYLKKTSDNRNFWFDHRGNSFRPDSVWDSAFPKFDEPDKETAIGLYWDMYHEKALQLQSEHPENFKIFHIGDLNSVRGRNDILDFVGFTGERNIEGDFRENSRKANRNFRYWLKQKLGLTG